jgi:hypothetical protein
MKRIYLICLVISAVLISSCNKNDENGVESMYAELPQFIQDVGGNAVMLSLSESIDPDTNVFWKEVDVFKEKGNVQLRSGNLYGPYNLVGYTGRTLLNSELINFIGSNIYNLQGQYVCNVYRYYYQFTIPHDATLILPPESQRAAVNMGWTEVTSLVKGYTPEEGSKTSNGDTYYLNTYLRIITHNILGQQVGPYYYPLDITNPSQFLFQYAYTEPINWGE